MLTILASVFSPQLVLLDVATDDPVPKRQSKVDSPARLPCQLIVNRANLAYELLEVHAPTPRLFLPPGRFDAAFVAGEDDPASRPDRLPVQSLASERRIHHGSSRPSQAERIVSLDDTSELSMGPCLRQGSWSDGNLEEVRVVFVTPSRSLEAWRCRGAVECQAESVESTERSRFEVLLEREPRLVLGNLARRRDRFGMVGGLRPGDHSPASIA